nr:unnamed protein product [Callosobruchus analis]
MDVETSKNGTAAPEGVHNGETKAEEAAAKAAAPRSKRKRSRSNTPNTLNREEAMKNLHVNITKLTDDLKGKEIVEKEENGKSSDEVPSEKNDNSIENSKEVEKIEVGNKCTS